MLDLIYKPFFEPVDREKANYEDKGDNVKHIEQENQMVLACADGTGKPDGMRQRYNLGERANIGG
jgi:hypothetical protein